MSDAVSGGGASGGDGVGDACDLESCSEVSGGGRGHTFWDGEGADEFYAFGFSDIHGVDFCIHGATACTDDEAYFWGLCDIFFIEVSGFQGFFCGDEGIAA